MWKIRYGTMASSSVGFQESCCTLVAEGIDVDIQSHVHLVSFDSKETELGEVLITHGIHLT